MEGLDSLTVIAIAFAAFIIGALLIIAVWYIHAHTGEMQCYKMKVHVMKSFEKKSETLIFF